ncbi:MAG: DUF2306 domain-containing protein [Bacteroidota bacterium]
MNLVEQLSFIHSWTGLFHTLFAIFAMLFGTLVFLNKKGTTTHKRLGYIYLVNMFLLNFTAFAIYNFGGFSLFHGFALVSLFAIIRGILPAIRRTQANWLRSHYYYMNWSVVGLYCAFWSEVGVRFFDMRYFWWVVMLATILTSIIGAIVINREARKLSLG